MEKSNQKLLTIIIPVFNAEKYIERCVKSILSQTYLFLEIILVNDGSTDKSKNICEKLASEDNRIKVITKNNSGVSSARNIGIDIAQGEYIAFVDADDSLHPSYVESAIEYMLHYDIAVVIGGVRLVYEDKIVDKKITLPQREKIKIYSDEIPLVISNLMTESALSSKEELLNCANAGPCARVYSKDAIGDVRFCEDIFIGEDKLFNLEVLQNSQKIGITDEIWYYYKQHGSSATKHPETKAFANLLSAIKFAKEFINKNEKTYKTALDFFVIGLLSYTIQKSILHKELGYNIEEKCRKTNEIMQDKLVNEYFSKIEYGNLDLKKRVLYLLYKLKMPWLMLAYMKTFMLLAGL